MASYTLYPPIVDSYMPAFEAGTSANCRVYFSLSKFNSSSDFSSVQVSVLKQSTGTNVVALNDTTKTWYNPETGEIESVLVARSTGIILNLKATKVDNKDNLYYIDINGSDLTLGWVAGWIYKIQLRLSSVDYSSTSGVGQSAWLNANASNFSEWSTICIVKATGKIDYQIPILDIDTTQNNNSGQAISEEKILYLSTLDISGTFIKKIDPSENIYSYQFILYDASGENILEDSGVQYSNKNQNNDSFHYLMKTELENGVDYKLSFKFETINQYVGGFYLSDTEDNRFNFKCSQSVVGDAPCQLITIENDPEDIFVKGGHVHSENTSYDSPSFVTSEDNENSTSNFANKIFSSIMEEEEEGRALIKFYSPVDKEYSGNLCIRRADSRDNFQTWTDMCIRVVKKQLINSLEPFYDYTIESGIWYKYGVQEIDRNGFRSDMWIIEKPIIRNFNYSFLLGKNNQQLKLKFDNTMGNFKTQIYDSKIDPIGSQFANITRNGATYYKVFPINGLISFAMDENHLFCTKSDLYKYPKIAELYEQYNKEHNISQYDYIYEKDFRNAVLHFLQDGEYKLFKSPTEGNVIVRLTEVQCTPNQSLDRLLYSFSANANEMAENNLFNYKTYGFYNLDDWASNFATYETKLGQIKTKLSFTKDNITQNIFSLIANKYGSGDKNIGGYSLKVESIHHVKVTFEDKPLRYEQNILGYKMRTNDSNLFVLAPNYIYEFDERLVYYPGTSNLIIEGPYIEQEWDRLDGINVIVDFLYDLSIDTYHEKDRTSRSIYNGVGQIFSSCDPGTNLYNKLVYKYYTEWPTIYRRLEGITSIEIEAAPGTVFTITEAYEGAISEEHIVGDTGQLRFYELNNLKEITYKGVLENGVVNTTKKSDILLNYLFILSKGTYKEIK